MKVKGKKNKHCRSDASSGKDILLKVELSRQWRCDCNKKTIKKTKEKMSFQQRATDN